jgi:hypothetical protein
MSYIQLEIGGKKRGLKFMQLTLHILNEYTDKSSDAMQIATAGYALVYAGLRSNSFVKKEEPDYTWEDVCGWVEKMPDEDIKAVTAAFNESIGFQADLPKEEVKKKKVKKITSTSA